MSATPGDSMNGASRVLGRLLLLSGAVGADELASALDEQRSTRERLGVVLMRRGVDPAAIARALAQQLRLPYVSPPLRPSPEAVRLVDRALAARLGVVPLRVRGGSLQVAMSDPLDTSAVDDLQFRTGKRVEAAVTTAAAVEEALASAYRDGRVELLLGRIDALAGGRPSEAPAADERDEEALRRASEAAPIVALVDHVLERAVETGASDIHVEPAGGRLRVRVRVDGQLRELVVLPAHAAAIVSRIKIMAELDIAVKLRPQDGRGETRVAGRRVGMRISTLPAAGGEKVVIRLLESENSGLSLDDLGMDGFVRDRLLRLLGRGHGALLVTGPTGSGKTTTLYGALAGLDRDRRNVMTLEDPIEYRLPGLTQVQVHQRAGLTFASGLRAALRQDPDVVMVGEMRDAETVEVGLAAALTGHLVLSTLHTNDAAGAVARLWEMGAPSYLVAGGLIGVLAQRLARRLCQHCRRERDVTPAELRELGLPARHVTVHAAAGCARCAGTGYHGRLGIFEMLIVDSRIRRLILGRAPADAIRAVARPRGMRPLGHDAWAKVRSGETSLEEVAPLLALVADEAPVCPGCGSTVRNRYDYCPGCARQLVRRCTCGARNEPEWRHCPRCGSAASPRQRTGSTRAEHASTSPRPARAQEGLSGSVACSLPS